MEQILVSDVERRKNSKNGDGVRFEVVISFVEECDIGRKVSL